MTARSSYNGADSHRPGPSGRMPPPSSRMEDQEGDLPLELEHMLGFRGSRLSTCIAHPRLPDVYIKSVGSAVVVGDLNDPHQQEFLRGHDMEISAMCISGSGNVLASGQLGTTHHKGYGAPVIVWDLNTKQPMFTLQGHTEGVNLLRFSPDERFLAAMGADSLMHIWDLQTGELIFGKKYLKPVALFQWCEANVVGRRTRYEVAIGEARQLAINDLFFDPTRQQWCLDPAPVSMPTTGMVREYLCSTRSADGDELLAGTSVGDLVIFKLPAKVFRAAVPVCSGGLRAVLTGKAADEGSGGAVVGGGVFCGGGDGSVRKLVGDDMRWTLVAEAMVEGAVTSLSLVSHGAELLVGTDSGRVYRMLSDDLTAQLVAVGHTNKVCCVAFGTRSDVFASGTVDGNLKVWDLSDYGVISETTVTTEHGAEGGVNSLAWLKDEAVLSGWNDCTVRCHDASTMRSLWEIAGAHRAAVTSVAVHADDKTSLVVSGAADGSVRVWSLRSREMMLQFVEHLKAVTAVLVDVRQPHLVHSSGLDCQVLTYDLRKERRTVGHLTRDGAFTSMSQRYDSEQELVTCDNNGKLLFWDCDVADPVQVLQSPQRMRMRCVSVSPTGKYLALCGDFLVSVFDLGAGGIRLMAQGSGHSEPVMQLRWSPDEKQIISVGEDSCVCVWNFYGAA